jgi:hypothetical protein
MQRSFSYNSTQLSLTSLFGFIRSDLRHLGNCDNAIAPRTRICYHRTDFIGVTPLYDHAGDVTLWI